MRAHAFARWAIVEVRAPGDTRARDEVRAADAELQPASDEDRIRSAAHKMWEEEGRPEGLAETHWQRACEMIAQEDVSLQDSPEWLQRETEIAPKIEKTESPTTIGEIKKRLESRAAA